MKNAETYAKKLRDITTELEKLQWEIWDNAEDSDFGTFNTDTKLSLIVKNLKDVACAVEVLAN